MRAISLLVLYIVASTILLKPVRIVIYSTRHPKMPNCDVPHSCKYANYNVLWRI